MLTIEQQYVETMEQARDEIRALRAQNASLAVKAQAYENMNSLIRFLPAAPLSMASDFAFVLDERINEIKNKRSYSREPMRT